MRWTHSWDDKRYGVTIVLAPTDKVRALPCGGSTLVELLDNWRSIEYTPGGLAWLDLRGSLRYAGKTAFLAFIYPDTVEYVGSRYRDFARQQVDYILGANPGGRSYVVGFGNNPPRNPHH
jgi:endoglucanase